MLIEIFYMSTAREDISPDDIHQILESSRKNNAQQDITGMLAYYQGKFLQILEGEQDAVEKLLERISQDPRHTDISVGWKKEITDRGFKEWSMAFTNLDEYDQDQLEGYSDFLNVGCFTTELNQEKLTVAQQLMLELKKELS